ncbi:hypothetical protein [Legionella fallonii]|uniref:Uncharacterized protein n=1 Tax=Legionella fallonii LLAP-10 TaxID=1212491 RepID=A0A098GAB0_9GAMM|nr:hypothetical protein [Legionella fallonii]CEG58955.1 protein of unknown function [Legionella fallonii LLAP-10]
MPHIPLETLGLSVPNMRFQHGARQVTRPISDHPPIIQNTLWGTVATLNMLHPGSPLAPPVQIGGVTTLPINGKVQMEEMAQYIVQMFQQGVGLLALQEVPAPGTANFNYLRDELTRLTGASNLIDVQTLTSHWLKTKPHAFGTTILSNPNQFKITGGAKAGLNNRAGVYNVTAVSSGHIIPVANIHGDFKNQQGTATYINNFDGICLGDLNISQSDMRANPNPQILQSIATPTLVIEGLIYRVDTVDVIQDAYSRQIKPDFTPDTTRITPPTIPMHHTPPTVFTIAKEQAVELLKQFQATLASDLIIGGKIVGLQLTTPAPYTVSHITTTNSKVRDALIPFYQNWIAQQGLQTQKAQGVANNASTTHHNVAPFPSKPIVAAIEILPQHATVYLQQVKSNLPPQFLDQSPIGIVGVELEMPHPGKTDARITFRNKEIYDFITRGFKHEKQQAQDPTNTISGTTQHSSSSQADHVVPPVIDEPIFQPVVIKIPAKQAASFLDRVKIEANLPPGLVQNGRITGVELRTASKSGISEITIKNRDAHQAIAVFYELWTKEQEALKTQQGQKTTDTTSGARHHSSVAPSHGTQTNTNIPLVVDTPIAKKKEVPIQQNTTNTTPITTHHSSVPPLDKVHTTGNDSPSPFQPIIIKMPATQAALFVKQFKAVLPQHFINSENVIGLDLDVPDQTSDASITLKNQDIYQKYLEFQAVKLQQFNDGKIKIQSDFIKSLDEFSDKMKSLATSDSVSAQKGKQLYDTLMNAQATFFQNITPGSSKEEIKTHIADFRMSCRNHFVEADKVMGHGWLYRVAEVVIKAVVGLFAAIGMALGVIVGQGVLNAEHRQGFKNTFFALDKTAGTTALEATQKQILGNDEDDQGLLNQEAFTPKN